MKLDLKKKFKSPKNLNPTKQKQSNPTPTKQEQSHKPPDNYFFALYHGKTVTNFRRTIKNYLLDITSNRCIYALRNTPFKIWNLPLKCAYASAIRHETKKLFSLGLDSSDVAFLLCELQFYFMMKNGSGTEFMSTCVWGVALGMLSTSWVLMLLSQCSHLILSAWVR